MYLHIGNAQVVRNDDIVGIFDLDSSTVSKKTRDYLTNSEKKGEVISNCSDLPKSFILVEDYERESGQKIYLSHLSSATLLKRATQGQRLRF